MKKRRTTGAAAVLLLLSVIVTALGVGAGEQREITLRWLVYGTQYAESEEVFRTFNEELQTFMPGVRVEFDVVEREEYRDRWNMIMATGERMDLAWFGSEILDFNVEVSKGSLMSLDFLLTTTGRQLKEEIEESAWKTVSRNGSTYAVPIYGPLYRPELCLIAQKTLMDRFGLADRIGEVNRNSKYTDQSCFDVIGEYLEKAKESNALGTGVSWRSLAALADKGFEMIYGSEYPFCIRIFDRHLTVVNKYETASWKAYFRTMADWYGKGYIRSDAGSILNPLGEDGRRRGSVLYIDSYGENGTSPESRPTDYEAEAIDLEGYRFMGANGSRNAVVLPKSAEHPEEAMELVSLLNSEEGRGLLRLISNGIERVHYILTDDGRIARRSDGAGGFLYQMQGTEFASLLQDYEVTAGEFEQYAAYNKEALVSPLNGFVLDTRMIAIEMERIRLLADKYVDTLSRGDAENWEELYDSFVAEMKAEGSDKVAEEIQRQIDLFLKEKS